MKKPILGLWLLVALALSSFAWIEFREKAPVDKQLYEKYLSLFEKVELPLKVSFSTPFLGESQSNKLRSYSYLGAEYKPLLSDLVRGEFSRFGPPVYYAVASFASTDKFDVLLYSESEPRLKSGSYHLQIIDKQGQEMTSIYLIGDRDSTEYAQFNADLTFSVYRRNKLEQLRITEEGKVAYLEPK